MEYINGKLKSYREANLILEFRTIQSISVSSNLTAALITSYKQEKETVHFNRVAVFSLQ